MRVKIHRGTQEIGGSCIELQAKSGERLVLDLGRPLWAGFNDPVALPEVAGFLEHDPTLLGVVISHPHLDHYGLVADLPVDVPLWIGREAAAVLRAASFFSSVSGRLDPVGFLSHRSPLEIGPFLLTPFLNDHSAFDAYSLLVEADGERLFYTGDIRSHGRKSRLFTELLDAPPDAMDVLLMEGTHVRSDPTHDTDEFQSEADLEAELAQLFREASGAVVVAGSAQNLDRLVTAYRAAKQAGRQLVIDLYGASVAGAARPTIPQIGFDGLRVWVPQRQRVLVKRSGEFERVRELGGSRVFPEELVAHPDRFAFHVPSSAINELLRLGVLSPGGVAVWSMWEGYLTQPSGVSIIESLAAAQVPLRMVHTSGHASVPALQRLVQALNPETVVPIHSEAGDRYSELFPRVQRRCDGEWWEVR